MFGQCKRRRRRLKKGLNWLTVAFEHDEIRKAESPRLAIILSGQQKQTINLLKQFTWTI